MQTLTLIRAPIPDVDAHDVEEVRQQMLGLLWSAFERRRVLHASVAWTEESLMSCDLSALPDRLRAAAFSQVIDVEGVLRAYRLGVELIQVGQGAIPLVGLLEVEPESGDWWLAWRAAPVPGVDGAWNTTLGDSRTPLPAPFRSRGWRPRSAERALESMQVQVSDG